MLPTWFKEYLSFHRKERNGVMVLMGVVIVLTGFYIYQQFFWKSGWEEMRLKYGAEIVQFEAVTDSLSESGDEPRPWMPEKKSLFAFDPNTLDSAGWVALGFSPKQSGSIIRYRNAGAKFRKSEDIKKLFVVDDARYEELRPFIEIGPVEEAVAESKFEKRPEWKRPEAVMEVVELNTADSATLVMLKGIGPSFAKRIISYRNLLGGYLSKEQLLEVYGMDSARYLPIEAFVQIDTTVRTRINVNTAEVKELLRHPYIDLNQAKAIVNYRQQHGNYQHLHDLRKIHLIKEESFLRLEPYLTVR